MQPDREAWLAAGGDASRLDLFSTLGEVAPFSNGEDRCLATIHPALPKCGGIGDWVGGPAVLEAAENWLRERGCTAVRGPLEMCTWFSYRANLGPYDEPPFAFEPTERPERWERSGYAQVASYVSALADHEPQISATLDRIAALSATGWKVSQLALDPGEGRASEASFREAVGLLHRIASESFTNAFGYVPIPEAALQASYAPLRKVVDPRLVLIARSPDGEPAGFLFSIPDFLQPQRGWFLVKTLAVLPRYRQTGVGSWLVAAAHQAARRAGYKAGVHSLMWEKSFSNDISRRGGRVFRRYALYEKSL
jgi:GNAT superfamily N-acetyltransferase